MVLLVSLVGGVNVWGNGEVEVLEFGVAVADIAPDIAQEYSDVVGSPVRGLVGFQQGLHGVFQGVLGLLADEQVIEALFAVVDEAREVDSACLMLWS